MLLNILQCAPRTASPRQRSSPDVGSAGAGEPCSGPTDGPPGLWLPHPGNGRAQRGPLCAAPSPPRPPTPPPHHGGPTAAGFSPCAGLWEPSVPWDRGGARVHGFPDLWITVPRSPGVSLRPLLHLFCYQLGATRPCLWVYLTCDPALTNLLGFFSAFEHVKLQGEVFDFALA